jgi:hypothetical protein
MARPLSGLRNILREFQGKGPGRVITVARPASCLLLRGPAFGIIKPDQINPIKTESAEMPKLVEKVTIDAGTHSYAMRPADYVDALVLGTTAKDWVLPEDGNHLFFSATGDFFAQFFPDATANMVTNGDFAADTDWTKGTGWTIAGGVGVATGGISTFLTQDPVYPVIDGQAYRVTGAVTRSAGGVYPIVGGQRGTQVTATGSIDEIVIGGTTQVIGFEGNGFTGTVDNLTITPVAIVPGADIIKGTAPELNPTQRMAKGIGRVSLVAAEADTILTIAVTRN